MDRLIVACVQQRTRLPDTVDTHRDELRRFLRAAQVKHARLVVFPELGGLLGTAPMLRDFRSTLLKRADQGKRRNASLWQRMSGALAGNLATLLQADLRRSVAALLDVAAPQVWDRYADLYGGLAREFGVTLVAPSTYLPDPLDGEVRNLTAVFGPNGDLLGAQAKMMLQAEEEDIAKAGSTWNIIATEVGRLGLILGGDALYPEVGRLLAYQGAEILIGQGACANPALYNKIRSGMLARMQDNQLFALVSFLVGENHWSRRPAVFAGKSAIFAPQELTPRFSGVLVEMGNQRSEGVLTAEWDFVALKTVWESSDTPVRYKAPLPQLGALLGELYAKLQASPRPIEEIEPALLEAPYQQGQPTGARQRIQALDDLPLIASITSRWPLVTQEDDMTDLGDEWVDAPPQRPIPDPGAAATRRRVAAEDETDEMDALPNSPGADGH